MVSELGKMMKSYIASSLIKNKLEGYELVESPEYTRLLHELVLPFGIKPYTKVFEGWTTIFQKILSFNGEAFGQFAEGATLTGSGMGVAVPFAVIMSRGPRTTEEWFRRALTHEAAHVIHIDGLSPEVAHREGNEPNNGHTPQFYEILWDVAHYASLDIDRLFRFEATYQPTDAAKVCSRIGVSTDMALRLRSHGPEVMRKWVEHGEVPTTI